MVAVHYHMVAVHYCSNTSTVVNIQNRQVNELQQKPCLSFFFFFKFFQFCDSCNLIFQYLSKMKNQKTKANAFLLSVNFRFDRPLLILEEIISSFCVEDLFV